MRVLTPSGYKDIDDCQVGDPVCAFDLETGDPIINYIEKIEPVILEEWRRWHNYPQNQDIPGFTSVRVNGKWTLFREQSIWTSPTTVKHARDLVPGDTIYDDQDNAVLVVSVESVAETYWTRLEISGDHSFIADGLTLHNASRFWIGGTGTYDSSDTTHWSASSGGSGGSSVPGSSDAATWDGSSGGGTCTLNFGGTITVQSFTMGAFTGTWDNSANNNNCTLSAIPGFSGTGSGTRTINLGTATYTLTNTGNGQSIWTIATTTNLTFSGSSSVIVISGTNSGSGQTFSTGGLTYGTVRISGARLSGGVRFSGASATIGTLDVTAAATIVFLASMTVTNLSASAQMILGIADTTTLTVTNAPTITGALSAPHMITDQNVDPNGVSTVTCTSGTFSGTYFALRGITFGGGATFSFTNSFDQGKNSGATITAPSASGGGISRARAFAGMH